MNERFSSVYVPNEQNGDLRQAIAEHLAGNPQVTLGYLFGSQVQGHTGPLSDYDIAILVAGEMSFSSRHRLAHELACLLEVERVDLVILNRAPIELRYNVVAEGQLLYQRDIASRVEFEADTLSRYADFLPVLKQQRREIVEGGDNERGIRRYRAALRKTQRVLAEIRTTASKEPRSVP
ncbi:MAG: nucleotidyltransferase domain-containing protein [Anaerolineae bacterium]|jgi:predicted nucleotidyltransferase|nr:nucleotidyltransferase domain-containing protein [Anaerolineae bacterium]MDH7474202.1 nucleotidyltransferase domain-containing protein [Anaerolineae bacterium]